MSRVIEGNALFALQKVRIGKQGGLDVTYSLTEVKDGVTYCNKYVVSNTKDPHPDLINWVQELQPIVANVFRLDALSGELRKRTVKDEYLQSTQEIADKNSGSICVIGLSVTGKDESEGVVIQCDYLTQADQTVKINTPKLFFKRQYYGFEEELEVYLAEIEKEVYCYLFEDKTAEEETFNVD